MKKRSFIILSYIAISIPGIILLVRYFSGDLGANPIQEATHVTGRTAINLLIATLAVSPIIDLFQVRWIAPLRRWLGVSTFFYAFAHFLIFVWWDYGLNLELILDVLLEKWFAIFGVITFLIFTALAVTSTDGWQKRLGKRWKKLHQLVYLSGVSAGVHYLLAVKLDLRRPTILAVIIIMLLIFRLKPVKKVLRSSQFNRFIPSRIKSIKLA
jgi:sulfoxide reductase heme-binding subunit YedZ